MVVLRRNDFEFERLVFDLRFRDEAVEEINACFVGSWS